MTNTYQTSGGKTQRLECDECGATRSAVTMVLPGEPRRGQGAYVLAQSKDIGSLLEAVKQALGEI